MKKILIFIIIILPINSFSSEKIINSLKNGKKVVFIRHAIAPGNGDPDNFDISDCSTQRNLNEKGRDQSKKIGEFFEPISLKKVSQLALKYKPLFNEKG